MAPGGGWRQAFVAADRECSIRQRSANWTAALPTPRAPSHSRRLPAITRQPENQTVVAGSSVTFGVTTTGAGPLAFQWRVPGQTLPGATNAALLLRRPPDWRRRRRYLAVVLSSGNSGGERAANIDRSFPSHDHHATGGPKHQSGRSHHLCRVRQEPGHSPTSGVSIGPDIPGATGASLRDDHYALV